VPDDPGRRDGERQRQQHERGRQCVMQISVGQNREKFGSRHRARGLPLQVPERDLHGAVGRRCDGKGTRRETEAL